MKGDDLLVQVLEGCISIEKQAADLYQKFHEEIVDTEQKVFWNEMAVEELTHVGHWQDLLDLVNDGLNPHMFSSLQQLSEEIIALQAKTETIIKNTPSPVDTESAFAAACHLEYCMMSSDFVNLYQFTRSVHGDEVSKETYDDHLLKFIGGIDRFSVSAELKLLGEVVYRVFTENRDLILQSHTDPLTGLYNRRGLHEAVKPLAHLANRQKFSTGVMRIAVDNLNEANANYGHQRGNEILKLVADVIKSSTRQSDISARYGGSGFLVYLTEVDVKHLLGVGEKIRRSIEEETRSTSPVTVSVGVAQTVFGIDVEKELEDLIKKADFCLYEAKKYRNKVVIMHDNRFIKDPSEIKL